MMDLNAILLALPAIRHFIDALIISGVFLIAWKEA